MNLPNSITLSRLLITIATFVCLEVMPDPARPDAALSWVAFTLFLERMMREVMPRVERRIGEPVTVAGAESGQRR